MGLKKRTGSSDIQREKAVWWQIWRCWAAGWENEGATRQEPQETHPRSQKRHSALRASGRNPPSKYIAIVPETLIPDSQIQNPKRVNSSCLVLILCHGSNRKLIQNYGHQNFNFRYILHVIMILDFFQPFTNFKIILNFQAVQK